MKKFLALIFSSALILGACGNDDTSNKDSDTKSEKKTEKKSEDKKDNKSKEDKKSKEEKKSQENEDNKSTQEDNSTDNQDTQETATNEQVQSQQPATQEQQQTQQANNGQQQSDNHEPTKEEIYEWDKQNIPGGTDYGLIDPEDVKEPSNSQNEDPDEWIKGQIEWSNATQSEKEEIRKRDAEKYGYEYDPSDYED